MSEVGSFVELHQLLAQWWLDGVGSSVETEFRCNLKQRHLDYAANCEAGYPHQGPVEGTRALAVALFGSHPDGSPYWSNNERRAAGLGPMPLRAIHRFRNKQWRIGRSANTDSQS
jgi:proteasome lid subunit RPN8/RPN11